MVRVGCKEEILVEKLALYSSQMNGHRAEANTCLPPDTHPFKCIHTYSSNKTNLTNVRVAEFS